MTTPDAAQHRASQPLLKKLDRVWRRDGICLGARRRMTADVAADLGAAAADGADPALLLTPDITTFARQVAQAAGAQPVRSERFRVTAGCLAGVGGTLLLAYILDGPIEALLRREVQLQHRHPGAGAVLFVSLAVLVGLGGALLGLRLALTGRPRIRATLVRSALLLPLATAVVAPLVVASSSASASSLVIQALLIAGACSAAVLLARRRALLLAPM